MVSLRGLALGAGALATLAACGGSPSAAPAASPSSPPASASQASGRGSAASAPAASGGPAAEASAPATPSAIGSPAPSAAASASGAASASAAAPAVKLTIAPNAGSALDIKMRELLAGNVAQNDAVESTKAVSGTINLDASGAVLPGSKISLDLRTLKSDRAQRDNFIKGRFVLDTQQYPTVDFVPTQIEGLGGPPPASGQKTFQLLGNATVRGVTKPLTWQVTASFDPQGCQGQASTSFKLSDFGMSPPKAGPVIQVQDAGNLVLSFQAEKS